MLEVTRPPGKPFDPSKHARILRFFESGFIFVRELDVILAEFAVKPIYDYMWLQPNDAAHLAAAIDTRCDVFYTYDQALIDRFDGEYGMRVIRPGTPLPNDLEDLPLFTQS